MRSMFQVDFGQNLFWSQGASLGQQIPGRTAQRPPAGACPPGQVRGPGGSCMPRGRLHGLGQHTPNEAEDLSKRLNAAMDQYDKLSNWLQNTPNAFEILNGDSEVFRFAEQDVRDQYYTVHDILERLNIGQTEFSDEEWEAAEKFIAAVPPLVAMVQKHTVTPTIPPQVPPRQPVVQAAPYAPAARPAVQPQARPGQAPKAAPAAAKPAAPAAPSAAISPLAIGVGAAAVATLVFLAVR